MTIVHRHRQTGALYGFVWWLWAIVAVVLATYGRGWTGPAPLFAVAGVALNLPLLAVLMALGVLLAAAVSPATPDDWDHDLELDGPVGRQALEEVAP